MSYGDWAASQQTEQQKQDAAKAAAEAKAKGDAQGPTSPGNGDPPGLHDAPNMLSSWAHDTFGKADDVQAAQPDWSTSTYGGTPEHSGQNQGMLYGAGDQGLAANLATGQSIYGKTQGAAYDANNTGRGLNSGGQGNVDTGVGMQTQQYGNVGNWLAQGPGPSVAQAQLKEANEQNVGNAMALAASGRGAGQNAAAQQAAIFGGLNAGQQTAEQASTLRAQEAQNWRGQQLQGMGMQSDIGGNIASTGANQQQLGLGYNQLGGNMQQAGNASLLSAMGQGQQNQQQFYNLGQQQLANETQARTALEQSRIAATEKAQEANQQSTYQHQGSVGGMMGAAVGALALM